MRKLSYLSGSSEYPLIGQTIGDYFDNIVNRYPDNMAIVSCHQNIKYSYEELQLKVN